MKRRILSIDGGGIRGIIPGTIISYLEQKLRDETKNPTVRISDYFDIIAGTSTGGILTCCYLSPSRYNAQQALELYLSRGTEIFTNSFWYKMKSCGGLNSAKYESKNFEKILQEYFGEFKLSQLSKPCVITAYDIYRRKIKIFNSVDAILSPVDDFLIRDVCRATSAAPTFFTPAEIRSVYGSPFNLVDGGVFANNPTMCAFSEAKHFKETDDLFILSISTGTETKPYDINKAKNWGLVGWSLPMIDILMSSNSEVVHYECLKVEGIQDYIRLQPSLCTASHEMDDASKQNISALYDAGKTFVEENEMLLNDVVKILLETPQA